MSLSSNNRTENTTDIRRGVPTEWGRAEEWPLNNRKFCFLVDSFRKFFKTFRKFLQKLENFWNLYKNFQKIINHPSNFFSLATFLDISQSMNGFLSQSQLSACPAQIHSLVFSWDSENRAAAFEFWEKCKLQWIDFFEIMEHCPSTHEFLVTPLSGEGEMLLLLYDNTVAPTTENKSKLW
jgi:hypothetical protein